MVDYMFNFGGTAKQFSKIIPFTSSLKPRIVLYSIIWG